MSNPLDHLIITWLADGFIAVEPGREKRPFGYNRTISTNKDAVVHVPCPNCDAPNERSNFLRPDWQFGSQTYYADLQVSERIAWLESPEGKAYAQEVGNISAWTLDGGIRITDHPSRYDIATCRRCGSEVIIPGGYLNWILTKRKRNRPLWYYKPCPIPPKIEYDIDGQLDAPVWFQYWWENGQTVKDLRPSDVSLAKMVNDHFVANVHTNTVDFFRDWAVDNWGVVQLHDHGHYSLGTGLWLDNESRLGMLVDQDTPGAIYSPLWNCWRIFVFECSFLGSGLPPDVQQEYLTAGLARDIYPDELETFVVQYAESRPYLNLATIVSTARIERERRRLAADRRQRQTRSKTNPRQQSMF